MAPFTMDRAVVHVNTLERARAACEGFLRGGLRHLAVDLEGVDLCRHGELCLLQVAEPVGPVFLFDVSILGHEVFNAGLRDVLEAPAIEKLFFDVRADADILLHQYSTAVVNVRDVQVLHGSAADAGQGRQQNRKWLTGLSKVVEQLDLPKAELGRLLRIKEQGRDLFMPDRGGSMSVWHKRPLKDGLLRYAALDVHLLFAIHRQWSEAMPDALLGSMSESRMAKAVQAPVWHSNASRDFPVPSDFRRLCVGGVPSTLPPDALLWHLGAFGDVEDLQQELGHVIVQFTNAAGVERALAEESHLLAGRALTVDRPCGAKEMLAYYFNPESAATRRQPPPRLAKLPIPSARPDGEASASNSDRTVSTHATLSTREETPPQRRTNKITTSLPSAPVRFLEPEPPASKFLESQPPAAVGAAGAGGPFLEPE